MLHESRRLFHLMKKGVGSVKIQRIAWLVALSVPLTAQAPLSQPQDGTRQGPTGPDPSFLTTQAQEKASVALRELFEAKVRAVAEDLDRQKEAELRANERLIKRLDEVPTLISTALTTSQALSNEKFKGVDQQFQGRDVALAAALLAQKTSVDEQNKANAASSAKQEGAITKQIDGIQSIILANSKGTDDKIDGVRQLLSNQSKNYDDKISEMRNTINDVRTAAASQLSRGAGQGDLWGWILGGIGVSVAVLSLVFRLIPPAAAAAPPPSYYPPPYYPSQNGYQPPQPQPPQPQVQVVPVVPVAVPK